MALDRDYYLALTYCMHLVTFTYTSFFFSSVWNLLGSSDDKAAAFGDAGMVTLKRLKICLRPLPHQVFT